MGDKPSVNGNLGVIVSLREDRMLPELVSARGSEVKAQRVAGKTETHLLLGTGQVSRTFFEAPWERDMQLGASLGNSCSPSGLWPDWASEASFEVESGFQVGKVL